MNEFLFEKPAQVRFSEQIATQIESQILSGRLRPGDKIPSERELCARFGVSKTTIRESIKLLEERGLLKAQRGRGAFVTAPNMDNVRAALHVAYRTNGCSAKNIHQARWALESFIVRLAAEQRTAEDLSRMEAAIEIMDGALEDPERYTAADLEFHAAIAASTRNPLLVAMARPLVELIQALGFVVFNTGSLPERHEEHKRLVACIRNRDAEGAVESLRRHLELSRLALEETEQTRGLDPQP